MDFGPLKMKIKFTVMKTNAFDALLGVRFLRRPEVQGLTFQPPTLQFKTGTVKLEKTRVSREELYTFAWHEEAYALLPWCRSEGLKALKTSTQVDLFANQANRQEELWCSPKWSSWYFDWGALFEETGATLWCNPPFSRLMAVLCKVVIDKTPVALVTPDWQADWRPLLDLLTVRRVALKTEEGALFKDDSGLVLPSPRWTCSLSLFPALPILTPPP